MFVSVRDLTLNGVFECFLMCLYKRFPHAYSFSPNRKHVLSFVGRRKGPPLVLFVKVIPCDALLHKPIGYAFCWVSGVPQTEYDASFPSAVQIDEIGGRCRKVVRRRTNSYCANLYQLSRCYPFQPVLPEPSMFLQPWNSEDQKIISATGALCVKFLTEVAPFTPGFHLVCSDSELVPWYLKDWNDNLVPRLRTLASKY